MTDTLTVPTVPPPTTTDPLGRALAAALESCPDPDVRAWLESLLADDGGEGGET